MFRLRFLSRAVGQSRLRRTFMSEGFACSEAWDKRLESRILSKVNLEDMYVDLEHKLNQNRKVTAIDVDIFANSINSTSHIQELEELVHRFRLTAQSGNTLESTHHAVVRALHRYSNPEDLLRILNDRLNYGIFPDDHSLIFLIDGFIKNEDFKNAAKVAALFMLQENFENKLLDYLALYSCYKYLLNPVEWQQSVEEKKEEEDEEETWVRVKYLRNPFFDDHFDLNDANSLVGKTLLLIGKEVDDVSHQILGAVLYKKYDMAKQLIKEVTDQKGRVYEVCLNLALDTLKSLPVEDAEAGEKNKELIASMTSEIENLKSKTSIISEDPLINLEGEIKKLVEQTEPELIAKQKETYNKWETVREEVLMEELNEIKRQSRMKEVERKKQELALKEEKLFFFENEDSIDIAIENKKVPYPKKWHGKKKKKKSEMENYVPPEVVKKYQSTN